MNDNQNAMPNQAPAQPPAQPAMPPQPQQEVGLPSVMEPAETSNMTPEATPVATPTTTPTATPDMTQNPDDNGLKKKKTGRIVGIIIAAAIVVAGLITICLLVFLKPSPEQAVGDAIKKLASADAHQRVVIEGTTAYTSTDENAELSSVIVTSKNQFDFSRTTESSSFNIQYKVGDNTTTLNLDTMFFADGTTYIRVKNIKKALQESDFYSFIKTMDLALKASGSDLSIVDIITNAENQWIEIDFDAILKELKQYSNIDVIENTESQSNIVGEAISCLSAESDQFLSNSERIIKAYEQNSFLVAEYGDKSGIEKKQNPLYKITFNTAKLSNFINIGISDNLYNGFYKCFGIKTEESPIEMTTAEDFAELTEHSKDGIFVEINGQHDITRAYFTETYEDHEVVNDYDISYPESIIMAKPTEYTTLESIFKQIEDAMQLLY